MGELQFIKKAYKIPVALGVIILTIVAISGIVTGGGFLVGFDHAFSRADSTFVDSLGVERPLCVDDNRYILNLGPFHTDFLMSDTIRVHADGDSTDVHFEKFHSEWTLGPYTNSNDNSATWREFPIAEIRCFGLPGNLREKLGFLYFLEENRVVSTVFSLLALLAVVGLVSYVNLWAFRTVFLWNYKWLRAARKCSLVLLCVSFAGLVLAAIVSVGYYYGYWLSW